MKKLTKLCIIAMLAFCPLVGTSAQEIYISPRSAASQEIANNPQTEYERPIYQNEYSATGVPPIRKSGTAFPRKVYRLSAKVYRSFFRL